MRIAALLLVLPVTAGCGSEPLRSDDASIDHDAPSPPDGPAPIPAPPALGAQIDRMGRPLISLALVAPRAADAAKAPLRDAYNQALDPATWRTTVLRPGVTIEREIAVNLAVFDAIDLDFSTPQGSVLPGCGNPLIRTGPPSPTFYVVAADLFADDQLHVDTSKATCNAYFALEVEQASGGHTHNTCGGRTLTHDVVDVTYSVLASGLEGLDLTPTGNLSPHLHDGVAAHADVSPTFPFLGSPHP